MRRNRRPKIIAATITAASRHVVSGSTVRGIAAEAGATEGAVNRHFSSGKELCQAAYFQIVAEMAEEKHAIVRSPGPKSAKFRSWIQVTFEYFDRFPEAFSCVLLKDDHFSPEVEEWRGCRDRC